MKILFITPDTSLTGAPRVLLHFLRWIKENKSNVTIDVLALQGGEIQEEFINTCHTFFDYKKLIKKDKLTFYQRVLLRLSLYTIKDKEDQLYKDLGQNQYDIVYANTILSLPIGRKIAQADEQIRLVAHVHELDAIIKQLLPNITDYLPYIHKVIAPSKLVSDNLNKNWDFPSKLVHTVYECALNSTTALVPVDKKASFIVGASGVVHWRKGYDVFIQLARHILKTYKTADIDFIWVGKMDDATVPIVEEDIRKLGLQEKVYFIGEVDHPEAIYSTFDVFVMISREDPFPLVCIEIGQLGKPIISFDQATGTNEILEKGGGFSVPYLDVEAMAEKVIAYYNNSQLKETHGAINEREFSKFTPELICPQIFFLLED